MFQEQLPPRLVALVSIRAVLLGIRTVLILSTVFVLVLMLLVLVLVLVSLTPHRGLTFWL